MTHWHFEKYPSGQVTVWVKAPGGPGKGKRAEWTFEDRAECKRDLAAWVKLQHDSPEVATDS